MASVDCLPQDSCFMRQINILLNISFSGFVVSCQQPKSYLRPVLQSPWCYPILRPPMKGTLGWALGHGNRMNCNLSKAKDSEPQNTTRMPRQFEGWAEDVLFAVKEFEVFVEELFPTGELGGSCSEHSWPIDPVPISGPAPWAAVITVPLPL